MSDRLNELIVACHEVEDKCSRCGSCVQLCPYLEEYGDPSVIAERIQSLPMEAWPNPFECSLCGLCTMACPARLQLDDFFLAMRRAKAEAGHLDLKTYAPALTYEKIGKSSLFSLMRLPEGGDTVLFPGCSLPATRPQTVQQLFKTLQTLDPTMGIVLDCCLKPSHDLGRKEFFDEHFDALMGRLTEAGVRRVLTACPNCQKVFGRYGKGLEVETVYNVLAETDMGPLARSGGSGVIHDPCPQRFDVATQGAVRILADRCGISLEKTKGQGRYTRCCGEGGMVPFVRPELADRWTEARRAVSSGRRMITSCAGCSTILGRSMETDHILDLFLGTRQEEPVSPPWTYPARLRMKLWFKRHCS